jgi:hypothetical protein
MFAASRSTLLAITCASISIIAVFCWFHGKIKGQFWHQQQLLQNPSINLSIYSHTTNQTPIWNHSGHATTENIAFYPPDGSTEKSADYAQKNSAGTSLDQINGTVFLQKSHSNNSSLQMHNNNHSIDDPAIQQNFTDVFSSAPFLTNRNMRPQHFKDLCSGKVMSKGSLKKVWCDLRITRKQFVPFCRCDRLPGDDSPSLLSTGRVLFHLYWQGDNTSVTSLMMAIDSILLTQDLSIVSVWVWITNTFWITNRQASPCSSSEVHRADGEWRLQPSGMGLGGDDRLLPPQQGAGGQRDLWYR